MEISFDTDEETEVQRVQLLGKKGLRAYGEGLLPVRSRAPQNPPPQAGKGLCSIWPGPVNVE